MPGLDVARALAVLGMVVVNYRTKLKAYPTDLDWLAWMVDRTTGKAAAVFVLLAGVGVTLRCRSALVAGGARLAAERRSLFKRAAVLFGLGLLNLHIWNWDILHCYGVYLAFAALLLRVPDRWLWILAVTLAASESVLLIALDYGDRPSFWTPLGAVLDLFFNGVHPVAPWMSVFLAGMWLGRRDLTDPAVRRRIMIVCAVVLAGVEALDTIGFRHAEWAGLDPEAAKWLRTWPRPPRPLFVVAGITCAMGAICLAVSLTQSRPRNRIVVALTATGQMAFSLYMAHTIAILIPIQHGLFSEPRLEAAVGYGLCFYAGSIAFSVWWRNRWPYGPLEGLLRQVTGPAAPALWGGLVIDPAKTVEMRSSEASGAMPPRASEASSPGSTPSSTA